MSAIDYASVFQMPKPVKITGRTSSITNSFVNGIIPVITPSADEIREALHILGMSESVTCSYCGDVATEWDHLRPLVVDQQPTGYISEIHNLVPACGKCNQSKGNKPWRVWMHGTSRLSPKTRNVPDLEGRTERLVAYEDWMQPTVIEFDSLVETHLWDQHWANHREIVALMKKAEVTATLVRQAVRESYLASKPGSGDD